jgi:hypothetical protein
MDEMFGLKAFFETLEVGSRVCGIPVEYPAAEKLVPPFVSCSDLEADRQGE